MQGEIEDMQGRFNLNNLAHVIQSSAPAGSAGAAGAQGLIQDPQPLEQFKRLLVSVNLEPKWADIARDWIDADDTPGPGGRRRPGLHLADSALSHRQLAHDVAD